MAVVKSYIEIIDRTINPYIVADGVLLGLGICSVVLRLYSRWTSPERKAWGTDDALILPALISYLTMVIAELGKRLLHSGVREKYGHLSPLTSDIVNQHAYKEYFVSSILGDTAGIENNNQRNAQSVYGSGIANQLAPMFSKLSICYLFLRFQVCECHTNNGNLGWS